ncbi:MAG: BlaR1 family beta-lactam sensor/signal transducer [Eubacteriales bacterium]|nr:BlaR1 family beta-lactam sensor/signal transducer [Eubacteriales bacterium]
MAFPLHFLISNVFISILLSCILFSKKILKKHITLKAQYHLWYIFVFALFLPFLPYKLFTPERLFLLIQQLVCRKSYSPSSALAGNTVSTPAAPILGLNDFSTAIASSGTVLNIILWGIWMAGMFTAALFTIYTMVKIYLLRKNAYLITKQAEPDLYCQFFASMQELHIKREVKLYASCTLPSPVSYGLIRPTIIIPQDLDILLSEEDVRYIFLHELQHYKHKDTILNYFVCLLQIIYWFNPFIWYGFRQLQKDREIACDNSVISVIGKEKCLNYGYTMIKYTEHMQKGMFFSPLSALGGSKDTIRQRIIEIADYKSDSVCQRIKSIGVMILTLLLVYCSSPLFTTYASQNSSFHLKSDNWESIDVGSYFDGADGSFVLYDMANDQFQIYNKEFGEQQVSPDSTFKIYSGLFALEENIISPDSSLQKWDGTEQAFDSWNHDQTLTTAMQNSVNWYFQDLDSQLGLATLSSYYHKISYGNCDLSGGIAQYWAESSLKISPVEQVILLSDLLENKWDFQEQNIDAVKNSLFISDTPAGKLYGKTGTGSVNGQNVNGWFIGFIEKDGSIYCFATNLQNSEICTGSKASEITMNILDSIL